MIILTVKEGTLSCNFVDIFCYDEHLWWFLTEVSAAFWGFSLIVENKVFCNVAPLLDFYLFLMFSMHKMLYLQEEETLTS